MHICGTDISYDNFGIASSYRLCIGYSQSGIFFAVIGLSLGFDNPASAQYVGMGLHTLTRNVAGNIFGQVALFWKKLIPYNMKTGVYLGLVLGISLWVVLLALLATFGIQPKLDTFHTITETSPYASSIANHFAGLYYFVLRSIVTIPSSLWRRLWTISRKNDRSKVLDTKAHGRRNAIE